MKAEWTPTGGAAATLGDDFNGVRMKMEALSGTAVEQVESLAFGAAMFRTMRGNVGGDCAFTARKSHATRDAAVNYFVGEVVRIGQVGMLKLTFDAATLTFVGATLRSVVVADFNGVEWTLRYTFGIKLITA